VGKKRKLEDPNKENLDQCNVYLETLKKINSIARQEEQSSDDKISAIKTICAQYETDSIN